MSKKDEALKMALEAFERCVATCFDRYAHEQVMSRPEHFVNQAITAIRDALTEQPAQRQELVYFCDYGYEGWGKVDAAMAAANLADGMTVEAYYTSPQPAQEPVATVIQFDGEKIIDASMEFFDKYPIGTELYTSPPAQRTWVGLTDEERHACTQSPFSADNYRAIEAKLREKNNG